MAFKRYFAAGVVISLLPISLFSHLLLWISGHIESYINFMMRWMVLWTGMDKK
jgi:hypothetical protein